jgi:glycosyltransferase involved in cell wall biosynthesis
MKIALAHDFLIKWGGAEKVLFDLHNIFPDAPLYTLFYEPNFIKEYFPHSLIKASYLQKKYVLFKRYHYFIPWIPPAVEALDFSDYDVVISSSAAFLKGLIVPTTTRHIVYLHTPTRWAWQDYQSLKMGFLKRLYSHFYRIWDYEAAQRPDLLITNSIYSQERIKKYYNRDAQIIYPQARFFQQELNQKSLLSSQYGKYFLILSRLSSYKRNTWAIRAFEKLPLNLVIAGEGRELKYLRSYVLRKNLSHKIFLIGFIKNSANIRQLISNSLGLIHLAEEDFGLSILEALNLGKPVIAYYKGSSQEIIQEGHNGYLVKDLQTLIAKINKCSVNNLKKKDIQATVKKFQLYNFKKEIRNIIYKT